MAKETAVTEAETPETTKSRKPRQSRPIVAFDQAGEPVAGFPEGFTDVREAMGWLLDQQPDLLAEGVQLYRDLGVVKQRAPKRRSSILVRE
jgi:hypothetical protein